VSDLAKLSTTRSARSLSPTAELLVTIHFKNFSNTARRLKHINIYCRTIWRQIDRYSSRFAAPSRWSISPSRIYRLFRSIAQHTLGSVFAASQRNQSGSIDNNLIERREHKFHYLSKREAEMSGSSADVSKSFILMTNRKSIASRTLPA